MQAWGRGYIGECLETWDREGKRGWRASGLPSGQAPFHQGESITQARTPPPSPRLRDFSKMTPLDADSSLMFLKY